MATVCAKCGSFSERTPVCPTCGLSQDFTPPTADEPIAPRAPGGGWQHSSFGRVIIGLLLAQGLALGLRLFGSTALITLPAPEEGETWSALYELLMHQGLELGCLIVACALAGAGLHRGLIIGGLIGLINALILQVLAQLQRQSVTEMAVYTQPLLHTFVGAASGLTGSLIWRPLPVLHLAPTGIRKRQRPVRSVPLFAGPIAWWRVLMGTAVMLGGVLSATVIIQFVVYYSQGLLQISSPFQMTFVIWEVTGLFILIGAGIAGYNTFNGLKQGLCVGIAGGFLIGGYQLAGSSRRVEEILFMIFLILGLSLLGSWFSCRLFPPVARVRRRRSVDLP
jgi:hypothetical protein